MMRTLYKNAKIFTSNPAMPYAEAMLVEGGRIKWIGNTDDFRACEALWANEAYETVDLGGRRVLPGFIDSHMHPVMLADYSTKISALPPLINSIEELVSEISRRADMSLRSAGSEAASSSVWIQGWGYDEGKFSEHRAPSRYDLDRGCSNLPVLIHRTCAHVVCVNSKALEIAGITASTPDPDGGQIERDSQGNPTGVLRENAKNLIEPFLPVPSREELVQQIVDLGKILAHQGVVACADMGLFDDTDTYAYYQDAIRHGFKQRVAVYYMWQYFAGKDKIHFTSAMLDHSAQAYVAGIKLVGDGSISGRTAWVYEPYAKSFADAGSEENVCSEDYGICVCSDELLEDGIKTARENHIQLSMHAMGGRAIDRIIRRMENEEKWTKSDTWPHLRLEHLTEPTEHAIDEAVKKGYWFSTQPIFQYSEIETYLKNMGLSRTSMDYPIRTMLEKGVNLTLSTDAPATSWATPSDPLPNIKAAVTRIAYDGTDYSGCAASSSGADKSAGCEDISLKCSSPFDERIDIETAIYLYTRQAALLLGMEDMGWLVPDARADFIVLDRDILTVPAEDIDKIIILSTYIEGTAV